MSEQKTYEVPPISGNEPKGLTYALYAAYQGDRGDRRLERYCAAAVDGGQRVELR